MYFRPPPWELYASATNFTNLLKVILRSNHCIIAIIKSVTVVSPCPLRLNFKCNQLDFLTWCVFNYSWQLITDDSSPGHVWLDIGCVSRKHQSKQCCLPNMRVSNMCNIPGVYLVIGAKKKVELIPLVS